MMKADFDGEIRRQLEEAALLPEDHPQRRCVVEQLEQDGDEAHRRLWKSLQKENVHLREELQQVSIPRGLAQELCKIPAERRRRQAAAGWRWAPWSALAAVLVLVLMPVGVLLWSSTNGSGVSPDVDSGSDAVVSIEADSRSVQRVASLVAADHETRPELVVVTRDLRHVMARLGPASPFPIHFETTPAAAELVGARICSFENGPLIYTRWRRGEAEISMYQLRASDYDIPANMPERRVLTHDGVFASGECTVRMWSDDAFAYAIVTDKPASIPGH